ncbi:MAG: helix-turn-helix transcriptional regulator [Thaumarchaeota archaeon]|nr:helix-turn-helix transcriptional regulator [Nitrososphaerota archaeon]
MLKIQDSKDREIMDLLSDQTNRAILESIMTNPKSASQICTECNIPTSTAYRKIQRLADRKIIRKIGTINDSGKRETLYKSNLLIPKKAE